ncbi:unnamed protein product [Callosobruchus maculatus]|uniref:Uncharacterized protein n=1 Tax=Callosobruchus maculatus TaxID=64391 RepID=A0A653BSC4_CALMS|nr:unnamed protein product [Callosobruchus maculatus]
MTHTTDKLVSMQQLTQKIHSKVTCVVWHPDNENKWLLVRRKDGRGVIYIIFSVHKLPMQKSTCAIGKC